MTFHAINIMLIGEIASFPAQVVEEDGVPVLYYNLDIIEKQYQNALINFT